MAKKITVVALATGYHGSLRMPGDEFTIDAGEELGKWMQVKGDDSEDAQPLPSKPSPLTSADLTGESYVVKHHGGGHYAIIDKNEGQVGELFKRDVNDPTKAKADAEAEADRLNKEAALAAQPKGNENLPDA